MFLPTLRSLIGTDSSTQGHKDLQLHVQSIVKDETDVKSVIDMIQNSLVNPFAPPGDSLVSISNGTLAPPDVTKDLLGAHDYMGRHTIRRFYPTRLGRHIHIW